MTWTVEQITVGNANVIDAFGATLTVDDKTKLAALLTMLAERGNLMKMPQSKAIGDGLYELRTKTGVRVFYTFRPGQRIILLGGIVKKRDDIPASVLKQMRARSAAVP